MPLKDYVGRAVGGAFEGVIEGASFAVSSAATRKGLHAPTLGNPNPDAAASSTPTKGKKPLAHQIGAVAAAGFTEDLAQWWDELVFSPAKLLEELRSQLCLENDLKHVDQMIALAHEGNAPSGMTENRLVKILGMAVVDYNKAAKEQQLKKDAKRIMRRLNWLARTNPDTFWLEVNILYNDPINQHAEQVGKRVEGWRQGMRKHWLLGWILREKRS